MKIALIHPLYRHKIFSENLRVVDEEFCQAPPIILAYVASILRQAGHKVILIDAYTLRLSKKKVLGILRNFKPDFLGFRLESYHFHNTLDWIKTLKSELGIPIIVGGINLKLYLKESLFYQEIDYGILDDALESLPKLLRALAESRDLRTIEGLAYRHKGKLMINPPSDKAIGFDNFPFPARDLLPNDKYVSFLSKRKNFTIMVTSRGCPYNCYFCAISNSQVYEERSAQNVVDEIEECYHKYNIREIDFFDATFFFNKKRFFEISKEMKKRNIKIEWSCRSRVDVVDEDIIKEAKSIGCRQILFGIESADQQVLQGIQKKISIEKVKDSIKLCRKYNILTMGFFMIGNPGETRDSINRSIKFAKDLGLDFVQFCRAIAKPNSGLNEILKSKTGKDYWSDYMLGKEKERRMLTPWVDLSQEEIEYYTVKAYRSFYFRPVHILKITLKVKSFSEFVKYLRVGLRMLFGNKKEYDLKR
ncbi:MAG: B12-binding domain-containing radical SAM protein [Candidatus Omnitrophica bacterium]|nr:B12-binding domain-containing radical SAM protein [Candidatus Omnitrophota bacterium]